MIGDVELAVAVNAREHWQAASGDSVVYRPPGKVERVRMRQSARPARLTAAPAGLGHPRYVAEVIRGERVADTVPFGTAVEAVRWAEQVPLS